MSESKDRLNFRMKPETAEKLEHWYKADHCRSKNEFVEKAVNFYADALAALVAVCRALVWLPVAAISPSMAVSVCCSESPSIIRVERSVRMAVSLPPAAAAARSVISAELLRATS